jgi:hypothetical protein
MEILIINNNKTVTNWKYKTPSEKQKEYMEIAAKRINSNTRFKRTFVFLVGSLMYCQNVLAQGADLSKINNGGHTILNIIQSIGYWIAIIMAAQEIIKNLMQGDTKSTGKSIMEYSLGYGSLYLLPWIFDLIKSIFS